MSRLPNTRGDSLFRQLQMGLRGGSRSLSANARDLPLLLGTTPQGQFDEPMENVLLNAGQILADSERVFLLGSDAVFEHRGSPRTLQTLASSGQADSAATGLLANLFICEQRSQRPDSPPLQYAPKKSLVDLIASNEVVNQMIPRIEHYSTRPTFDHDFAFRAVGWYPEAGYLVHGVPFNPIEPPALLSSDASENIPPTLRSLLQGFLLESDVDLVHVIAVLLTGMLSAHFVRHGKPVVILDGNQPGLGKTWLARTIGIVLDGADPDTIPYVTNDEELGKRICASLRAKEGSLILFDNAKHTSGRPIDSPLIEANSMAPEVSFRILTQSNIFSRPNTYLWVFTMNETKLSPDMVSRGFPIRFHHDGNPATRNFDSPDPLEFAYANQTQILGELAGLIERWVESGRPNGDYRHRLQRWAEVIGGILDANGITGFLENIATAAASFNTELDSISALAERALRSETRMIQHSSDSITGNLGLAPSDLVRLFNDAGILVEELAASASDRAKATKIGRLLSRYLDHSVPIEHQGDEGTATLRRRPGRGRSHLYYFTIAFVSRDDDVVSASSIEVSAVFPTSP